MSPVSWGDIFTLPLRGDRIMELRQLEASFCALPITSSMISCSFWTLLEMRILVLSDLHANATALKAALAAAEGRWQRVVCLGDVVGYGPDPNEVTSKIRELGAQTLRGNHDKAVTGLSPTDDFNPVPKATLDLRRCH